MYPKPDGWLIIDRKDIQTYRHTDIQTYFIEIIHLDNDAACAEKDKEPCATQNKLVTPSKRQLNSYSKTLHVSVYVCVYVCLFVSSHLDADDR